MAQASSKRSPERPRHHDGAEAERIGAWIVALLMVPRLVRLFYPEVWVEDDFYLESAWLVSAGMRPYLDFVHPHLPLLEWIAGGYLKLFGASHFSIEVLNEAAIYATSILTFKLAARAAGRRAAICAAILYASSSLVFRYHVYERECFVAPLIVAAALLVTQEPMRWERRAAGAALAIAAAAMVKLTAVVSGAAIVVFVAVFIRRWREAAAIAVASAALLLAFIALCFWLYGNQFIFQVFLFHLMKGRLPLVAVLEYPLNILDVQFPMMLIGIGALAWTRRTNRAIVLVLAIVAVSELFYGILSPTAWGHNFLEPLPFIAILGGIGADWIIETIELLSDSGFRSRYGWTWLGVCGAVLVICLGAISPLVNENWLSGSCYGFGFLSRDEVIALGEAVRDATGPDEEVVAPSFICFQANRRELIRFPETYGVLREAELEYHRDGYRAARTHLANSNFFRLIADTAHFWRDPILSAIADRKVRVVILDSEIQMLPLVTPPVMLPPDIIQIMIRNGFRPALRTEHFLMWRRE